MNYTNRFFLLGFAVCTISLVALGQVSNSSPRDPTVPSFPHTGMTAQQLQDALKAIEQVQLMPRETILSIFIYKPDHISITTGIQRGPRSGRGKSYLFKRENGKWQKISESDWVS